MVELIVLVWYRAVRLWILTTKRCFGKLEKETLYQIFYLAGKCICAVRKVSIGILSPI